MLHSMPNFPQHFEGYFHLKHVIHISLTSFSKYKQESSDLIFRFSGLLIALLRSTIGGKLKHV